ncbi:MAG: translation elongation factor Ts [Sediminibacterium sp.]|nr:translation elongation factor Ts [Sediminibacterium sp.]
MSQITANDINKLRQITGAGILDCKKALNEANGDHEIAIDWLRKQGKKIAEKRLDREAKEGVVISQTTADNKTGYLMCLSCETDFVAKNADFIALANDILQVAVKLNISSIENLLNAPFKETTVNNVILEKLAAIGEKIEISKYQTISGEYVTSYIHGANRIGVLVALNAVSEEVGRNIAMQVAALNPVAISADKISQDVVTREQNIILEQLKNEPKMQGKSMEMLTKISQGKLQAFFKEQTLLGQPFVKNQDQSVEDYINSVNKNLKISDFKRITVG